MVVFWVRESPGSQKKLNAAVLLLNRPLASHCKRAVFRFNNPKVLQKLYIKIL